MKTSAARTGLTIFGAALIVRAVWVLLRWQQVGPTLEFDDEHLHWQLAENLVRSGALVSDDGRYVARMPFYPLFLALFAWIGPAGILAARLAQAVLGAAVAWLAFSFTSRVFGFTAAVAAGILVAVDPYLIFFSNLLLTEVPFALIGAGLTVAAFSVASRPARGSRGPLMCVAALSAAAVMTRPSSAGWIVLLWLTLWLLDADRIRAAKRTAVYVAVLVAVMLPWGVRNKLVVGGFAWLSANGGVTLYDAQGPQADGSSNQAFMHEIPELAGLDELGRDEFLYKRAIEHLRLTRVFELAWIKFRRTWSLTPNAENHDSGAKAFVSAVYTGTVLVLAAIGLARTLRSNRRLYLLLWLPVAYFTLLHCIYIGSLRYRVPVMPFVEITAAAAFINRRAVPNHGSAPRENSPDAAP